LSSPLWIVAVLAAAAPAARAADRADGSLALGHPALHSEAQVSGGTVKSDVPAVSVAAAHELLVTFRPGTSERLRTVIRTRAGVTLVGSLMHLPVELVRVSPPDRHHAIARLRGEADVSSVQSDPVERPDSVPCARGSGCRIPDDPGFPYQWYLYSASGVRPLPRGGMLTPGVDVDAPLAWSRATDGSTVRIAILDSGVDASHPDLAAKLVAAANFTASNSTDDQSGHGTHVAGIAAASFNNGVGIAGMAPNARLMNVKVLAVDATGRTLGDCAGVSNGIVWATDHGANVLNLSLGSNAPCQAMALAVSYAFSHGALVVAAAGNDGTTVPHYPAAYPDVLSVAATDGADELASFSNRGASWVDVAAPGVDILSTLPTTPNALGATSYGYLNGTSMAAPVVSGIAALIWPQMPAANRNVAVQDRLFASAQRITGTGTEWRYGSVDACRAVTGNAPPCAAPPKVALSPPPPAASPSQPAQPAPVTVEPPQPAPAIPGTYRGSLGAKSRPLALTVADGGQALISFRAKNVMLSCAKGNARQVNISVLSRTNYGEIAAGSSRRA
jgi:thermitase